MTMKLLTVNDGMIRSVIEINSWLRPEYFCCPTYHTINGQWISDAFKFVNDNKMERLKFHVTAEIISPWRRAFQTTELYQHLNIFRPYLYLLDVSTIAFLEGNWLCSHLSLVPVIEGIFREWAKEAGIAPYKKETTASLISRVLDTAQEALDTTSHYHRYLNLKVEFLRDVLKNDYYQHGEQFLIANDGADRIFNRHIPSHMLKVPNSMESGLNTANLLLFLDLIAEIYLASNSGRYKNVHAPLFGKIMHHERFELYWDLFKRSANKGINDSSINRLHNLCYRDTRVD